MDWRRRDVMAGAAATLAAGTDAFAASAGFPQRNISFIIPSGPGGGFDSYVRAISRPLENSLPRRVNVIPTNIDGAGGAKAANQLYRAKPDGSTIGVVMLPGALTMQMLTGASGYDLGKVSWLCSMGRDHFALAVGAKSPIRSVADLQALSKKRPVKFTTTGPGSTARAGTLIAAQLLGIRPRIIAGYKGTGDYLLAAARGDGDAAVASHTAMTGLAAAGIIRIIATFETHSSLPGIPDATSLGQPELAQIEQFRLIAGPPRMSPEVQQILSTSLIKALRSPGVVAWGKKNNANLTPEGPAQAAQILRQQMAFMNRWKKYVANTA